MATVRALIRSIQTRVRDQDLPPAEAAELAVKLSALYGNVLDEVREAEMEFNNVLLTHMNGTEAANRAKIRAQTTDEYKRLREAQDTSKLVLELTRSLKSLVRLKQEEMRLT